MKCTRYDRWLWDDLEGRLSAAQAQELHAHLQSCPRCQRQRDAVLATYRALHALPRRRAPQNLAQQVRTRLQEQSRPKHVSAWWKRVALAPALGLVAAAAWWGWLAINPNGGNSEVATKPSQSEESWVEIHEQLEVADWSPTASYFIKTGYTR
jgi:anti-sigma factor RsiW